MEKRLLGETGFEIAPLVLGGNVFGWTADEATSFAVLDAFVDAGLNAIDTADAYSRWVPGHTGGESETIIGNWLRANPGKRDKVVLITKVGSEMGPGRKGLSERWIVAGRRGLAPPARRRGDRRLPLALARPGHALRRDPRRLRQADRGRQGPLDRRLEPRRRPARRGAAGRRHRGPAALPGPAARLQPLRPDRAGRPAARPLPDAEGLGVITYFGLAKGFLSGKYRSHDDLGKSPRGGGIAGYLDAARLLDPRRARHRRGTARRDAGRGGARLDHGAARRDRADRQRDQRRAAARAWSGPPS